ncbi:MAG: 1-deoxy-D-xylulose-5-phosphate synthase [Rhodothermaceae bacterium]
MIEKSKYKLLFDIESPKDVRELEETQLKQLCDELREYVIDVISQIGGHFGSGLGTVELTVALHRVFNTPEDKIVWDVGHQCYPHKVLTGRRDVLNTIRKFKGISGFLKRSESEYDVFGAGHASTSISAALGIAEAGKLNNEERKVVAVIGDGSMTGGMAYEALNNSGVLKSNLIVVLNDNNMSIAPNVWGVSNYFTDLMSHPEVNKFRGAVWDFTGKLENFGDRIRSVAHRLESGIKAIVTPGMLFEALGFKYFGPVKGHNIKQLTKVFERIKNLNGPVLVHVMTEKGKGYQPAEDSSSKWHASNPFDKDTGEALNKSSKVSYTSVFGNALKEIAAERDDVIGITAAMPDGTGLNIMQKECPDKFYDVGIAEEHAVTFAAGLATEGIVPVTAIYSSFLQRAIDQIIHDVALQKLHVVFALDRAGLVGADGPTHHGCFDLSYLRMIPNMVIMSPKDEAELRNMLWTAVNYKKGPIALRYPRGNALGVELEDDFREVEIGKGEIVRTGEEVAIFAVGNMVDNSLKAAEILEKYDINCTVVNARYVKPLDTELIDEIVKNHSTIVTVEENSKIGGFGSGVSEYFSEMSYKNDLRIVGLEDKFVTHGTQNELHKLVNLDPEGLAKQIAEFVKINI